MFFNSSLFIQFVFYGFIFWKLVSSNCYMKMLRFTAFEEFGLENLSKYMKASSIWFLCGRIIMFCWIWCVGMLIWYGKCLCLM
jgi:hypothetical protein